MDSARERKEPDQRIQDIDPLKASTPILTQAPAQSPSASEPVPRHIIWMHRISMVVFVVFCIELGMFIAVLPWISVWSQNHFLLAHPALRQALTQNFVRGTITGVGIIDVWIGIWEAIHYHDPIAPVSDESEFPPTS